MRGTMFKERRIKVLIRYNLLNLSGNTINVQFYHRTVQPSSSSSPPPPPAPPSWSYTHPPSADSSERIHRTGAHSSSGNQQMTSCHGHVPDHCKSDEGHVRDESMADEDGGLVPEEGSLYPIRVWWNGFHA